MKVEQQELGEGVTLYCGDALWVLDTLPDESMDALITDPPYSSGGMMRGDRMAQPNDKYSKAEYLKRVNFSGDNRDQHGYEYWATRWLMECFRILRPGAVIEVFTDWRQLPLMSDLIQAAGFVWRGVVVWDKTEAARPQPGRFRQQAEFVLWGSKGPLEVSGTPFPGVYRCVRANDDKLHITGKPVALMRALLQITRPDALILDPFMGSGSTGVAAVIEGRRFAGIEVVDEYNLLAAERIKNALLQGVMFDGGDMAEQLAIFDDDESDDEQTN